MSALSLRGPLHFVGIGGAGMSPLAEILRARGHQVSGSDEKASETTARLKAMGILVHLGHDAANVAGARCLVFSSAIKDTNPEMMAARARGIPALHRGEVLEALMAPCPVRVAISGSHGKTTTTAMIAGILEAAGFDPTVLVGGKRRGSLSGARLGGCHSFVAEADESDRSFLRLRPTLALVTNVDREHLDAYEDMEEVSRAFAAFARSVPEDGQAVWCADDPISTRIFAGWPGRATSYGFGESAEVRGRLSEEARGFPRVSGTGPRGSFDFTLGVRGEMNALNALGAMAVAQTLNIAPALASRSLASFLGVARRLEWKGQRGGIDVWDDYGHHPTEIGATLKALKSGNAGRRLVTLFQPHRVSRTRALWNEFTEAFVLSDELWLSNIYAAGEAPEEGITAERLVAAIAAKGRTARFAGSLADARKTVLRELREHDVFLTLGAGDVAEVGEAFLAGKGDRP